MQRQLQKQTVSLHVCFTGCKWDLNGDTDRSIWRRRKLGVLLRCAKRPREVKSTARYRNEYYQSYARAGMGYSYSPFNWNSLMLLSSGREGWQWTTVPRQSQDDERIWSSESSSSFISLFSFVIFFTLIGVSVTCLCEWSNESGSIALNVSFLTL